jgi:chromosomal replication initiator protein
LHAIANQVIAHNPTMRVCYISAESFMNELIESIQHQKMPGFRAKYRDGYDVLLIDDVQFIAGKTSTEEEFFHTFNALHAAKKQIVISSDRPPKDIEKLEERIRTRFEWGLVSDIQPPEIETRIAILKAKAERDDVYLPDDVATFLATHVKNNVRALEGVLVKLKAQASLTGAEISLEMAKSELKSSIPEENSQITVETIQSTVAKYFQIKVQDLKSTSKKRTSSLPRQIAFYLVRKYTGLGFKEIGLYFGGKDHSTVVYGCDQIERAIESDPEIRNTVESIQNLL